MDYTATKFDTVDDKIKFEAQFKKFVLGDFHFKHFPKWFYTRLSMTFGHIAHYDQHGFFNTFFVSQEGKQEFINSTINHHCLGDPEYTYSDVERELVLWTKDFISGKL
jgi:hypothetical protein